MTQKNTKMQITIQKGLTEQKFIEGLLNMKVSGCDVLLILSFYALASRWHIDTLNYYINLLANTE